MNNKKKKLYERRLRLLLIVLICIWLLLIFSFSQQDGNSSSELSFKIAKFLFKEDKVAKSMQEYIRKIAHMFEFAIGGGLFSALFMTYNFQSRKRDFLSIIIVTAIAILDEIHQSFIPGRNGVWYDVLIDIMGCICGILIIRFVSKLFTAIDYLAINKNTREEDENIDDPYRIK